MTHKKVSIVNVPVIHTLVIAPYEGIRIPILQAAEAFPRLQLDVRIADLDEGVALVERMDLSIYDVIVSRGGTAQLIRPMVALPVVDIEISMYDVLKAMRLASSYGDRYAVVGFPNITAAAHTLCDLLQEHVRIETVHGATDAASALDRLIADGYHVVICDAVSHSSARQRGL